MSENERHGRDLPLVDTDDAFWDLPAFGGDAMNAADADDVLY